MADAINLSVLCRSVASAPCGSAWSSPDRARRRRRRACAPTASGSRSSGYAHLLAYDHVLGADPAVHPGWNGPYDIDTTFHEPFVLFGYLAAITSLELVTGIIILPAAPDRAGRQAGRRGRPADRRPVPARRRHRLERGRVRGARQGLHRPRPAARRADRPAAPAVDRASGDLRRPLRAGHRRRPGAAAGAAADPASGSAAQSAPAYRRIGRLADGWFPQVAPGPEARRGPPSSTRPRREAGPRPGRPRHGGPGQLAAATSTQLVDQVGRWREAGATHLRSTPWAPG